MIFPVFYFECFLGPVTDKLDWTYWVLSRIESPPYSAEIIVHVVVFVRKFLRGYLCSPGTLFKEFRDSVDLRHTSAVR